MGMGDQFTELLFDKGETERVFERLAVGVLT